MVTLFDLIKSKSINLHETHNLVHNFHKNNTNLNNKITHKNFFVKLTISAILV